MLATRNVREQDMSTPQNRSGAKEETPLAKMVVSMVGAGADEHETTPPGVNELSVKAGHEPDAFGARAILYVPAIVALTLVLAYVLVTTIFSLIVNVQQPGENANAQVIAENKAPINERFARISSTDPKPLPDVPGTAVPQPRLEFLKQQGDVDSPPYERSKRGYQVGNPPDLMPSDLRPENYVDPKSGHKILVESAYIGDASSGQARISIEDAIHLIASGKLKSKFPISEHPITVRAISDGISKISNGGHVSQQATMPQTNAPVKH